MAMRAENRSSTRVFAAAAHTHTEHTHDGRLHTCTVRIGLRAGPPSSLSPCIVFHETGVSAWIFFDLRRSEEVRPSLDPRPLRSRLGRQVCGKQGTDEGWDG